MQRRSVDRKEVRSRTFWITFFVTAALGIGGAITVEAVRGDTPPVAAPVRSKPDPATPKVAPRPASSSTTTTTTTSIPLPQPEDAPADPRAAVPVIQTGEIEIPKIGLKTATYEGIWLTVLDVGPGHWPGSAEPGGYGNAVIAGHRVTNSKPFRRIDELVTGDSITVRTTKGSFTYAVDTSLVVSPEDTWIAGQTPGYFLTIFACHPPGSARYRYVVQARLANTEPPVPIPGMA